MNKKIKEPTDAEILRLAAGLCGFVMTTQAADTMLEIVSALKKRGDQFNLKDVCEIEGRMERKYKKLVIETKKQ